MKIAVPGLNSVAHADAVISPRVMEKTIAEGRGSVSAHGDAPETRCYSRLSDGLVAREQPLLSRQPQIGDGPGLIGLARGSCADRLPLRG